MLAVGLAAGGEAAAQEGPPEPVAPAFALGELASASATTSTRVAELAVLGTEDRAFADVREAVPTLSREIAARQKATQSGLMGPPNLDLLADLGSEWSLRVRRVESLSRLATERSNAVTLAREELLDLRMRWEATLDVAKALDEPPETLRRIEENIAAVRGVRSDLRERLNDLLTVQSALATAARDSAASLQAIGTRRTEIRAGLFQRDQPAIWSSQTVVADGRRVSERLRGAAGSYRDAVVQFIDTRRSGVVQVALLVVACLAATLRLRERARDWRDAEGSERSRLRLLARRPISTGLLLAFVLSPILVPDAPRAVQHTMGLVLLVPLLRILHRLLPVESHRALWIPACFYLLDRVRAMLAEAVVVERWLLFGEAALAAVLGLGFLRSPLAERISGWRRIAARGLAVALAASALGNAAGFDALARILGEGALQAIYGAIAVFAALEVARSLVQTAFHTSFANRFRAVGMAGQRIERRALRGLEWLASAAWVWIALDAFAIEDSAVAVARAIFGASVSFGEVSISLGDVSAFVLTFYGALLLSRFIRFLLEADVYPRVELERGVPHAISATLHYAFLLAGFYLAVAATGVDLSRLTIVIGALGVGIGFGLQNVVNNFVSGLILLYERPVQVGDAVEVGSVIGQVHRIGIRSSTVRTYQGAEVIVPNADLISNQVTNWTLSDRRRRIEVGIGAPYGSDPERVRRVLLEVARAHPRVSADPPPMAIFQQFGDSALVFQLRAWVENVDDWLTTGSELHTNVARAFEAEGIEIPFPQQDLHVRSAIPIETRAAREPDDGSADPGR